MTQALHLWSELEASYYGKNKFGGDTAELYAHRFGEFTPLAYQPTSPLIKEWQTEQFLKSANNLFELLTEFATHRDCEIKVNGRNLGLWLKKEPFAHRVHVQVIPK